MFLYAQGRAGQLGPPGVPGIVVGKLNLSKLSPDLFGSRFIELITFTLLFLQGLRGQVGAEGPEGKPGTQVPISYI